MNALSAEIQFADGTEYVATVAFATSSGDTPSNQLFRARLADASYERSVSFAVHRGDGARVPAVQEIVLINADGALDSWLDRTIKDRTVILKSGRVDAPYSTWTVRQRAIVDKISLASRTTISIKFRAKLQVLEKQATPAWVTAPNPEVVGSRRPVAIGKGLYFGGVLYQHYSNFERFYSVSDWPIHSITNWWSRYNTVTPGYYVQGIPEAIYGLRRRSTTTNLGPDDRMCLEMRGAIRLGTEMLGADGEFSSWTAGVPDGWTVSAGSGTVTESPTGSARIDGEDVFIIWDGLVKGQLYHVEVLTYSVDAGVFQIMNSGTVLHYEPGDTYFFLSPRVWRLTFEAYDTELRIGVPVSATGTVVVDRVRLWPATPVDKIQAWVEHLVIDRGGLVTADLDSSSLEELETAKPYDLAFANEQGIETDDLLLRALDSLNAALFEGLDGRLKAAWLQDPTSMSSSGTIYDADLILGQSWEWEDDDADGLSTSLRYSVNYAQLTANEIQALQSFVTLPQATVESLRRADRKVYATTATHSHYQRASEQDAAQTLIVDTTSAQNEVNNRCGLFASRRKMGGASLRDLAKFEAMEPGQCWTVESTRWGTFKVFVLLIGGTLLGTTPIIRIRVWR